MDREEQECPSCGEPVLVDEEYMQSTYGAGWLFVPKEFWSYYCSDEEECGEAGLIVEGEWV